MNESRGYTGTRKYQSEKGVSDSIYDVLPDTLTLYPELNPVIWRDVKDSRLLTIFQEVDIVPFDEANPHAKELLEPLERIEGESVSEEEYASIMWRALRMAIEDLWEPESIHVVFASSGYDSRLIALTIWDLYQELGEEWLGDICFIEADGEAEQFLKNMLMIGWNGRECIVYNEGAPDHEYHERSFDFEDAWQKLGGMCGYPVSMTWEGQEWLRERSAIPMNGDGVQVYTGYSSNEIATTMRKGKTLYEYFQEAYLKGLSNPKSKIPIITPFNHFGTMRAALKYGREHIKPGTGLSQIVLNHLAPKELAGVPSPKHKSKKDTVRKITESLQLQSWMDYHNSWFGKLFPDVEPTPVLEYHPWWAHWCVASFCEHLLREGHEICKH